ncbi:hypothetical protein QM996_25205 (plasmid) [Sinorhizobium chiapasense]|uniref:hypothetical protein n=1 Tax=Sinorhizobium chiapasense TaxID=501572 RepID=UPI002FE09CB9
MKLDRRSFMRLAGAGPALALLTGSGVTNDRPTSVDEDDGDGTRIVLSGEYGYAQKTIRDLPPETTIDARRALFTVANSRNAAPNAILGCDIGMQPVNPYPIVLRNCPGVHFVGGRINGEVPLQSDWAHTYCNSAGLLIRDGTTRPTIEGVRARRCWDGIRFTDQASGFYLKSCWLSEIRDDAVEDDYLLGGVIEDCLFDGCFSGVSLDPASNDRDGHEEVVTIDRSLIRMQAYLAKGDVTHQAPVKASEVSPKLKITNSVFAFSSPKMRGFRRLERTWQRVFESHGNTLLWLPDDPIPPELPLPPDGFDLLSGNDARDYWNKARRQWISAHPDIARFSDDEL